MEDEVLSSLPDEILQHILSFLETRDAVRTSILSTRWRHLWRTLPILNIDSDSFAYYSSFSNFVFNLLCSRSRAQSHIAVCKFRFDISNPIYSSIQMCVDSHDLFEPLVAMLIRHVTTLGVHRLSLLFPRIVDDMPLLFSCPSLTSLHLHELVILPRFLGFATLTTLHLVKCSFVIDVEDSFDPFRDFVHLTNLLICDCRIPSKVKTLEISAPHLVNMTISCMQHVRNLSPDCKIVLSSTKISSFAFVASHILNFSIAPLPSIERVYIDVAMIYYPSLTARKRLNSRLIDMFRAIGDAKTVTLSFQTIVILALFPDALRRPSPFIGMKILKLRVVHEPSSITIPVDIITFLLNGSPARAFKVEYLKHKCLAGEWEGTDCWFSQICKVKSSSKS